MSTPTVPKLPTIRGCGAPATVRIEIYTPVIGNAYGSLDGSAYTCAAHADAVSDTIAAADLTPYRCHRPAARRLCGDGFDYKARQAVTAPAPTTPTPIAEQLAAALRAGATDPQQSAALDILLGLPYALYARQDLRNRYISHTLSAPGRIFEAVVLWTTLYDDLRTDQVPVSPGERRMLLIACSIAVPANPVSLNEVLTGVDHANALLVVAAVERLVRGHR